MFSESFTILPIKRNRHVKEQKHLSGNEREQNAHRALSAESQVKGRNILVVDDIITSGATLSEARRALLEAGAASVTCMAVFETKYVPDL